jgi:predicted negative regulator of RcsB-dependent stress response
MKNKTLLTVGALAVLGVLGYNYYKKHNKKATGSLNMSGYSNLVGTTSICRRKNYDGTTTIYTAGGGSTPCPYGGSLSK